MNLSNRKSSAHAALPMRSGQRRLRKTPPPRSPESHIHINFIGNIDGCFSAGNIKLQKNKYPAKILIGLFNLYYTYV
jgi:hypothetical protein